MRWGLRGESPPSTVSSLSNAKRCSRDTSCVCSCSLSCSDCSAFDGATAISGELEEAMRVRDGAAFSMASWVQIFSRSCVADASRTLHHGASSSCAPSSFCL